MGFSFILNDPSGNSYLQNPSAPTPDQYCSIRKYARTYDDYREMGFSVMKA